MLRAMARWPDVPAVYGWLSLDRRGRWLIKGETIGNAAALAFIGRNYAADGGGRWYFQNGPQRVFVALEAAPWVLRFEPDGTLSGHTGAPAGGVRRVFMDEDGAVMLDTALGPGLLDDRDLDALSQLMGDGSGAALDEDALICRVDRLRTGEAVSLSVRLCGAVLPVAFLASADAPGALGFQREPGPGP